jgi:N-acetylmuramoyl-L-alanine amidase
VLTQVSEQETPPARKGGRVMVTDIRHWSTPNYTRVAIDLGGEVRFQAGRVPNPDRIYFDLYNTRLAPQLMGHLISVDGDAFLKDIRAAQYTQEITRVVLDVGSLSEYSAFLLPNPYRLIIDVHGRKPGSGADTRKASAPTEGPGVDSDVAPAGVVAPVATAPATNLTKPAKPARTFPSKPLPLPETVLAPVDKPAKPKSEDKKAADNKPSDKAQTEGAPAAGAAPATKPSGDVDANGHETGVANPPSDVSTTPEETPATPAAPATPPPAAPSPGSGSGSDTPTTPQNLVSQNTSAAKPSRTAKGAPLQQDSANEVATLQQQPRIVRAKKEPTTRPVVDTVVPRKDDATDAPPFAKSVVPGAAPLSAASTQTAISEVPAAADSTPPNSLNTPPITSKHKRGKKSPATSGTSMQVDPQLLQVHEAEPTASGERSLVRALGLKIGRIVIDPGHGGHDAGTVGQDGIAEKDVVLDVSLRLGKLLRQRLGADVTFTRSTDVFVPLETRTAIANKAQADLFVSIHANSSPDPSARGVETYYLNFTSSPDALDVAARENAVSQKSIHDLV